ncbi:MAG: protein-L-isoaspartate(D-aspartate) O-methyltransferase [Bacteroidales bacterium]|jgi:protein-L-isoaspartate(D-aspartate) O-methyltransferase|nr:protein-L-isoaspartate(D-aspartate) O-methyltransferase [Bacteroidales bacterium]MBR4177561.1 protein-L-isoaspartate(D-aspartate) O-methyltransferase [Bacteroidales bacterium]MBR4715818.1 protein-L-isoaspartate(D-aspartate) O-methyltransferase [Bacteroidales bacterium]MCR4930950.1 protein-L-isoaspartate(D-aspartate) O-methyltransferase [Bacteroidales bacterium]
MEDSFKHKGWRMEMVKKLGEKGISDQRVLTAMSSVPRHLFLETMLDYMAYEDRALPIKCGQTISQPSTVAFQSELLDASPEMKVLEVGTGSGYQTAVLCAMGLKVYTIERQKELYDITKPRLEKLHYRPKCFLGDGYKGLPEYGPFDRILVTCGAPEVPEELLSQLKVGGVMVVPVGNEQQEMLRIVKMGEKPSDILQQRYGNCNFVPMLGKLDYGKL